MRIIDFGSNAAIATGVNFETNGNNGLFPGQPVSQTNSGVNNGTAADFQAGRGDNHVTNLLVDIASNDDPDQFTVRDGEQFTASFDYEGISFTDVQLTVNHVDAASGLDPNTGTFVGTLTGQIVVDGVTIPISINVFPGAENFNGLIAHNDATTPFVAQFTCFCAGTRIEVADGRTCVIEELKVGDLVRTSDGLHPIRWIGSRHFGPGEIADNPKLRPIRIRPGALGQGLPERTLVVSRQHRMLVSSKISKRMFGTTEVLVPAIRLTALPGIDVQDDIGSVTYFHIMFDEHAVVFAEGAPSESLLVGPQTLKMLPIESRNEVLSFFPELMGTNIQQKPARYVPEGRRQKNLIARHLKNGVSVLNAN